MAPCMNPSRSAVVRLPQLPMKRPPWSAEASLRPPRSAPWQPAQFAWYAVRPASACAAVNGATAVADCCAVRTPVTSAAPAMPIAIRSLVCDMDVDLLLQKPAPQNAIRGLLAVNLDVEPALLQVGELRWCEVDRSRDHAACRLRDRELADQSATDSRGNAIVQLGRGRRAEEAVERSRERQLRAIERCSHRASARQRSARPGIRRNGSEPRFIGLFRLRA